MVDQIIAYTEEMVGSGHPTKADTLNRALKIQHNDDGTHTSSAFSAALATLQGLSIRSKFAYKDTDEIYISPAVYHHSGTTEQLVYWDSQLTYAFANLASSDWSYLYLDDSAIVTAGTNLITASELIDSTTEPTWSNSKHGWYNGEDKCIFAVVVNGATEIIQFQHDGGDVVQYSPHIVNLNNVDIDTTWTDVTLTMPIFSTMALVSFWSVYVTAGTGFSYRTNGTSDTGIQVGALGVASTRAFNSMIVSTDAAQIIEVVGEASNGNTLSVFTFGFYLPIGM